jgi:hypothetical protein
MVIAAASSKICLDLSSQKSDPINLKKITKPPEILAKENPKINPRKN